MSKPRRYLPFLGTLFLFVAMASLFTIVPGYEPPTGSLSTTTALSAKRQESLLTGAQELHQQIDAGTTLPLPNSISAITPLIGQVLLEVEKRRTKGEIGQVFLFHNRPVSGSIYEPVRQRLLPLDAAWQREIANRQWPTKQLPEVMADSERTLLAFVREYLFVSLFRACAESLASENASRLAAMQRAEKNIDELLENLTSDFHRLRQSAIDEELFDVVSGFEAFSAP